MAAPTALAPAQGFNFGKKKTAMVPTLPAKPADQSVYPTEERDQVAPQDMEVPLLTGEDPDKAVSRSQLIVNLNIPHQSNNMSSTCTAYPYPMQPPKPQAKEFMPLATRTRQLKQMIQN
ncbi:MAG: hypothetical protein ACRD72_25075, partial [Candidatus Angelobacter sp.]